MNEYGVCAAFDCGDHVEKTTSIIYANSKFDAIQYFKELHPYADYVFILD